MATRNHLAYWITYVELPSPCTYLFLTVMLVRLLTRLFTVVFKEKAPSVRMPICGDGNCYFRSIPYILYGMEKFHLEVRKAVCDFIKVFDRDLKPFLRKGEGEAYIKESNMRKSETWANETEILATAKIMKRDVFTFTNTRWQRFP